MDGERLIMNISYKSKDLKLVRDLSSIYKVKIGSSLIDISFPKLSLCFFIYDPTDTKENNLILDSSNLKRIIDECEKLKLQSRYICILLDDSSNLYFNLFHDLQNKVDESIIVIPCYSWNNIKDIIRNIVDEYSDDMVESIISIQKIAKKEMKSYTQILNNALAYSLNLSHEDVKDIIWKLGSIKDMSLLSVEEIMTMTGLNKEISQKLYEIFNSNEFGTYSRSVEE